MVYILEINKGKDIFELNTWVPNIIYLFIIYMYISRRICGRIQINVLQFIIWNTFLMMGKNQ